MAELSESLDSLNETLIPERHVSRSDRPFKRFVSLSLIFIALLLTAILILEIISMTSTKNGGAPTQPTCTPFPSATPAPTTSASCPFRPIPIALDKASLPAELIKAFSDLTAYTNNYLTDTASKSGTSCIATGISYGNDIIYTQGVGVTKKGGSVPPDQNSIFRIGSVTKTFVMLGLEQLAEKGLNLDDAVCAHESRFVLDNPFDATNVTFRQLLAQMSGMAREFPCTLACFHDDDYMYNMIKDASMIVLPPWTKPSYSNAGFAVAGHVLGKMTGSSFGDSVKKSIFDPLGMSSTGNNFSAAGVRDRLADGFTAPGTILPDPGYSIGWAGPAGDHYSSIYDLSQLMMALMDYPHSPFPSSTPSTKKPMAMSAPHIRHISSPDYWNPGNGHTLFGSPWEIQAQFAYMVRHKGGNVPGYSAVISYIPELHMSLSALFNGAVDEAGYLNGAMEIMIPALTSALGRLQRDTWKAPSPPDALSRYAGSWGVGTVELFKVSAISGRLFAYGPTLPPVEAGFYFFPSNTTAKFSIMLTYREGLPQSILDVVGAYMKPMSCMMNELLAFDGDYVTYSDCSVDSCKYITVSGVTLERV